MESDAWVSDDDYEWLHTGVLAHAVSGPDGLVPCFSFLFLYPSREHHSSLFLFQRLRLSLVHHANLIKNTDTSDLPIPIAATCPSCKLKETGAKEVRRHGSLLL